jgi:hypothetical protein
MRSLETSLAGFSATALLPAAREFWERFFAGYHTGGTMLEIWLSLAVVGSVTDLCMSWFGRPRRAAWIIANARLLVSAVGVLAASELKQRDRRSDKVGVAKLMDEERKLKQMHAQP